MNLATLTHLELEIARLSDQEQLWLIERLIHRLRDGAAGQLPKADQLAAMASDPEIIRELRSLREEFAVTEMDGLGES